MNKIKAIFNLLYLFNFLSNKIQRIFNNEIISGLFNHGHMAYEVDREPGPEGEPSLAEMTRKAIEMLRKNSNGYFLMVEGKS